ncbi:S1C family serine protease [Prochlorothrix hollandica]|uniref:S1C family serine protease n=1 Tax=Prochlorothrix hollandica TaxID=1223 RepID=UPI00333F5677
MRNHTPYRPPSPVGSHPPHVSGNPPPGADTGFPAWLVYGFLFSGFCVVTVLTNLDQLGQVIGADQFVATWPKGDRPAGPAPPALPPANPPVAPVAPPPAPVPQPPDQIYQHHNRAVVVIYTGNSQGSGALIRHGNTTLIITNDHVVDDNPVVRVETVQGLTYEGLVRGRDPDRDLAIVEITTPLNLPSLTVQVGDATIGQTVYALGNPIGLDRTLTQGIVSRIDPDNGDIQHSAAIAPGSSGSPLLNDQGRVIGVNKAVFTRFDDLAIATPAQDVVNLCDRVSPKPAAPTP